MASRRDRASAAFSKNSDCHHCQKPPPPARSAQGKDTSHAYWEKHHAAESPVDWGWNPVNLMVYMPASKPVRPCGWFLPIIETQYIPIDPTVESPQ
jgi:hypothetical protein